jgi:hypothetical protein
MPQPVLKAQSSHYYKPKIVLERPELAAGIGLVAAEWGALEEHLLTMCTFNIFTWDAAGVAAKEMTEFVLSQIDSLRARLDLVESILEKRLPAAFLGEWQKIAREVRKRANERNRVVHGHWHASFYFPNDLILRKFDDDPLRYTVKDFTEIADRIIATSNQVQSFWFKCRKHLFPDTIPKVPVQPPAPQSS